MSKAKNLIHKWHEVIESDDLKMLDEIIADNAVFSSPVVFKPMEGKEITMMYLHAAGQSFNMEKFKYTKEIHECFDRQVTGKIPLFYVSNSRGDV